MHAINLILWALGTLVYLWAGFGLYAVSQEAYDAGRLGWRDLAVLGCLLVPVAVVDVALGCLLYGEFYFRKGYVTLSQRSCFWIAHPENRWRYGVAHAVKTQANKFQPGHIKPITGKLVSLLVAAVSVSVLLIASGLRLDYVPAAAYDVYQGTQGSKVLMTQTGIPVMVGSSRALLSAVSASGVGSTFKSVSVNKGFQATLSGASAVSATVLAEASIDGLGWLTLATLDLTAASPVAFASAVAPYPYVRGELTAISGAGAAATLLESE